MEYSYDEKNKCVVCEPDCAQEWIEAIGEYGSDYDGEGSVEGLKRLIDELIDCSHKAYMCLSAGNLFPDEKADRRKLQKARDDMAEHAVLKIGYCPLCDRNIEEVTNQIYTHCPTCGHRIGLKEKI